MTDTTESTALRPASMPSAKGAYGAALPGSFAFLDGDWRTREANRV